MNMFGSKQKPADFGTIETVIGEKTKINGQISCDGSLRVSGDIEGKIEAASDVFIGEKSKIKGDVAGNHVIVAGEVNGNVTGWAGLEIEKSGVVHGDLSGDKLVIEEGATYKGKVYIGAKAQASKKKSIEIAAIKEEKAPSATTEVYQLFQQSEN
ncbi:MAG: polymer-forming cytoskeletal protein [Candidatus Margulisbacteria bacterium]|nr:polymer-forming cytoskeletal protein [Candidatus Margulisiibacteriota bacterium]MBU1021055.1 polymer-forming cytoskeletal protein [Candidatus Margulisiibacteriota bacterium]MBU1729730.1 polymer-forming cytoskeletal protein [Candidatus Margulisiibacteriota bacterium]MBU1955995.1 polymer-forming cytoskeletal protein [Candidatus Margulisiibacteriota bacterium]